MPPSLTLGEELRLLRTKDPLIRLEDLAAQFGWTKEVMRAIERDEIRLASRGGSLTADGPKQVSYELIRTVIQQIREGKQMPVVSRRHTRSGMRVATVPLSHLAVQSPDGQSDELDPTTS